jgi:hypothetical protein
MSMSASNEEDMTEEQLWADLEYVQARYKRHDKIYLKTDHHEELVELLGAEAWSIDRIVIIGIGCPPNLWHVAMIVALADWLTKKYKRKITIYSQEQQDRRTEVYEQFLAEYRIINLVAEEQPHKPASTLITPTTLVFAPSTDKSVMQALRSNNPELYIGVSMGRMKKACSGANLHLSLDAKAFKVNHEWKAFPQFAATGHASTDLNDLVIYRRKEGMFKDGNRKQGPWVENDWESAHEDDEEDDEEDEDEDMDDDDEDEDEDMDDDDDDDE